MARKSLIAKQKQRKKLVDLKWDRRQALKKIIKDLSKSEEEKQAARNALNKMSRRTSPVGVRKICQFTGRTRGFLGKFKMSRLCFLEKARHGYIPGVVKASW